MALIHQLIASYLPKPNRTNSSGWITFDAPCCVHRGHKSDKRKRGNLIMTQEGEIGYNCYNCSFGTRFDGINLSKNFELLLNWFKIPYERINEIKLELLSLKLQGVEGKANQSEHELIYRNFNEVELPPGSIRIEDAARQDVIPDSFIEVISYLSSRGSAVAENHDYYWCNSTKHDLHKRLLIPFYHRDKIVGWTARYAGDPPRGVPRYYNGSAQKGYLFNAASLEKSDRLYALLLEGPLDAISVDGVSPLGSELSQEQLAWLNSSDKEIIVVPDRQRRNQGLIDQALRNGWSVSFPDWEDDVKDAAEASKRYGRIYTLRSIIASKTDSQLQINVKRRMFKDR
jgi:hypothetical protein